MSQRPDFVQGQHTKVLPGRPLCFGDLAGVGTDKNDTSPAEKSRGEEQVCCFVMAQYTGLGEIRIPLEVQLWLSRIPDPVREEHGITKNVCALSGFERDGRWSPTNM